MIKKLHDEWEKLSEEARTSSEQDPERMKQIAERMSKVSAAMQRMSQASVTRTTLSQAVRDALKEILRSEPVLPEVSALRDDLAALRQQVDERLSAPPPEPRPGKELTARIEGIAVDLGRLAGRMGTMEDSLGSTTKSLQGALAREITELGSRGHGEMRALKEQLAGLASSVERLTGRFDTLEHAASVVPDAPPVGSGADGEIQALKDQFAGLASGLVRLTSRIGPLEDSVTATEERLKESLAGEVAELGARGDGQIQALREHFGALESGLGQLAERVSSFESSVSSSGPEIHAAISRELAALDSRNVGAIQEMKDRFGRELEAFKDHIFGRVAGVEGRIAGEQEPRLARLEEASAGARALVEELQARSGALAEDLLGRADGLEKELSRRFDEAASSLSGELISLAGTVSSLAENVSSLTGDFSSLGGTVSSLTGSVDELSPRLEDQAARLAALGQDLTSADDHLAEGLKDLESRLGGRITTLLAESASRIEAVEGSLQNNLAAAETRLSESQGLLETRFFAEVQAMSARITDGLSGRIMKLEEALPALRAMEERLRTEMEIAMEQTLERMNSLVEMVGQIQTTLPPREVFTGMDERLDRLETRFRSISDLLGDLEGAVPELRSLGARMAGVREEVANLLNEFSSAQKDAHGASELFARKIQDLQDLLRSLLERWNADRSNFRQRLVDLRDTLRDQLQAAIHASDGLQSQGSFWGKLMAKPENGLRFGMEEWERFRARMETILQGLESLAGEAK